MKALLFLLSAAQLFPQQLFVSHCAACHGPDARGTAQGPGLASNPRIAEQSEEQLLDFLKRGNVAAGMPAFSDLPSADLVSLAKYLRRINVEIIARRGTRTQRGGAA
jgi:mono/diheme cytochrome c family protein